MNSISILKEIDKYIVKDLIISKPWKFIIQTSRVYFYKNNI